MKKFLMKVWDTIGLWIMIAPFILVPVVSIILGIIGTVSELSKPKEVEADDSYYEGYEAGYAEGYNDGYYDGIDRAQASIESRLEDDLWSLSFDIEDEYSLHPEDALQILSNYADVPDEVDEEELNDAIWAIYRYYYKSHEVINGIEDYWID